MRKAIITLAVIPILSFSLYSSMIYLKRFDFNENNALDRWGRMVLNGQVKYELTRHGENGYVEALSEKACSALYYRLGFSLKEYPLVSWKWKVLRFPDKSYATTEKERDDYAARMYIIFPFLNFSSSKFIEYIWDDELPVGTVTESPEGDNIRLIVVRSGEAALGEWFDESRNVYDDYVMAFGKKPNLNAGAIAIMCDADSTKTEAESSFDDITIGNDSGAKRRIE